MLQVTAPQNFQKLAQYKSVAQMEIDRETLIMTHLSKVKYIADRIAAKLPSSVERDDLYGAGVIGLIDAVERYDPSRGVAFTTFAEMRVRGAILDNLRSLDWASRTVRRRAREVQNAYGQIEKLKGAPATEEEVALHLRMPLKELHNILREISGLNITDLDEQDEKTGLSLMDTIYDTGASPFEAYEDSERRQRLSEVVDKLPERERQVIALYYVEELNMKEIGAVLGITESRVSQLRTQAVVRMRANLAK
ncbi:MAG: FliA/WhiG family RNA polymerase sigma factor [Pyrinomonadaceae bacterium]|nr:FliA/WhiG family RNA polymerase sigma factor [Pyrinomonadaceae bacterium]